MKNAAQAAASGRLRLRLQALQSIFQNIRSPGQLTDAMAEGGCIYFELMQAGLVSSQDMLRNLGIHAQEQHCRTGASSDVADHAYQMLWIEAAGMYSLRKRLLLRPVQDAKLPQWQLRTSTWASGQAEPTVVTEVLPQTGYYEQTQWDKDYAEQGQRYALFVAELLAQLQTADVVRPLTVQELEPEVARICAEYGKHPHITAERIADLIKKSGKVTSKSNVQKTNTWQRYVELTGKKRNPAATLTNTDATLELLLDTDEQVHHNNGRRNKKPVTRDDD